MYKTIIIYTVNDGFVQTVGSNSFTELEKWPPPAFILLGTITL